MNTTQNWTTAPDYSGASCDYCGAKAIYDAKTENGCWVFACEDHFRFKTLGRLGLGFGQRLVPLTEWKGA
jgi:hypothetical protein